MAVECSIPKIADTKVLILFSGPFPQVHMDSFDEIRAIRKMVTNDFRNNKTRF